PPVDVTGRAARLDARMPFPHEPAVLPRLQAVRDDPAVVVDARIGVGADEMLGRLLDALPRLRLRRTGPRYAGPGPDLRSGVHDDQPLQQQRRAALATPVETVQAQPVDDELAVERTQEVHGAQDTSRASTAPMGGEPARSR